MEETTSTTAEPMNELSYVKDLAGGSPILSVILVLVLIVGGKAGWKFWTNLSKNKHEEKMKQLEHELEMKKLALEEKKVDKGIQ